MEQVLPYLSLWYLLAVGAVLCGVFYKTLLRVFGVVIIAEDRIGIVNKKFVIVGSNRTLPGGAIIALNGEAGYQADTLAPGLHYGFWPWQYEITHVPFVVIPPGYVGTVEACDGAPFLDGRVLGKRIECNSFQDARAFLTGGGQRGPQNAIITPGSYRINPRLFTVKGGDALEIPEGKVGVVKTMDGTPLDKEDIAGPVIRGHDSFQNAEAFINGGGRRGLQEQVMLAGRYYVNPLFVTVECVDMTVVPIANVGVVISYVGDVGVDTSGEAFTHGNLVRRGHKGVWDEPLDPGRYPINPKTHKMELVPTANVVLNWDDDKVEKHSLDQHLKTIDVRGSDGYEFALDVSQVIAVSRNEAPRVVAQFGTMASLVTQVLEPTVGNYFRNAAQVHSVIQFLSERSARQAEAKEAITAALAGYHIRAVDTLIGGIYPPDEIMKALTDRKLAFEQQATYATKREAENERQKLEQARATAETQAEVVASQRKVEIADFNAKAAVKQAEGSATAKTIEAKADAEVTRVNGEAEAGAKLAVGTAEAKVVELKITSMEAGNYASIEVARHLAGSKVPIVPGIMAGGNGSGDSNTLVDVLLATLVRDNLKPNGHRGEGADA